MIRCYSIYIKKRLEIEFANVITNAHKHKMGPKPKTTCKVYINFPLTSSDFKSTHPRVKRFPLTIFVQFSLLVIVYIHAYFAQCVHVSPCVCVRLTAQRCKAKTNYNMWNHPT